MAKRVDISILTELTSDYAFINIIDITDYVDQSETREEFGLALFVKSGTIGGTLAIDDNLSDLTDPGNDLANGEWFVSVVNQMRYELIVFSVESWDNADLPYAINSVVYYDEVFYIATTGTSNAPPHADWTVLDGTSFTDFETAESTIPTRHSMDSATEDVDAVRFQVEKISCHNYTITDTVGGGFTLLVEDYLGNEIVDVTVTGTTYDLVLSEDNVYLLTFETGEDYVIYEWCDLRTCVSKMIKYILCKCDDPCDSPCTDIERKRNDRYRHSLNKMMSLYFGLIAYIHVDKMSYMNVFGQIDGTRYDNIQKVGQMIDRLQLYVGDCGNCTDDSDLDDLITNLNCE